MSSEPQMPRRHHQVSSILAIAGMTFTSFTSYGDPLGPQWWKERGVINETSGEANFAPVNVGQAKWMASQALEELRAVAPTYAANIDLSLVFPEVPLNPTDDWYRAQKKPLNLGQLKAISKQFYDALPSEWLAAQATQNGITNWNGSYPWDLETPEEQNYKLANIGQLKAVFSLRFSQDHDNNGEADGLVDLQEYAYFGGLTERGDGDYDGDGIPNLEELAIGKNPTDPSDGDPNKVDSDKDGIVDLLDAVPNDALINWERTPEARYVWIEVADLGIDNEVLGGDHGGPVAINKHGQVLFTRDVWKGGGWLGLPQQGSVKIQEEGEIQTYQDSILRAVDLNDSGAIAGVSRGLTGKVRSLGFVWKPTSSSLASYHSPVSFAKKSPIESAEDGVLLVGGIGADGAVLCSNVGESLDLYLSAAGGATTSTLVHSGEYVPGAMLNSTTSLAWSVHSSENGQELRQLVLQKGATQRAIGSASIASAVSTVLDTSLSYNPSQSSQQRLWLAGGNKVYLEASDENGSTQWLTPESMAEGAIRVNARGEAITTTKVWRNGKYHPLLDMLKSLKPQSVIANLQAIDLSSNGLILARADINNVTKVGVLHPIEVSELAPKLVDESGNEIESSDKPSIGQILTPLVEVDPYVNRIAHREMKVKLGELLKDKKVTWELEAIPGASPETIRGKWVNSPDHHHHFEASAVYGEYGYEAISIETMERGVDAVEVTTIAQTTIANDGYTAIRVNIPPIGFNQIRVKIQIEGVESSIDLIDMEVPGVVVIDPGHGGIDSGAIGSSDQSVKESDLVLSYSHKLREELIKKFRKEGRNLQVRLTRSDDSVLDLASRSPFARREGADIFVSIHFNSADAATARGSETFVERTADQTSADKTRPVSQGGDPNAMGDNVNQEEDVLLARDLQQSMVNAVLSQDIAGGHRPTFVNNHVLIEGRVVPGVKRAGKAVTRDGGDGNGNVLEYHPVRSCLLEVEFLSNIDALKSVDLRKITGVEIEKFFAESAAKVIYDNIMNQK